MTGMAAQFRSTEALIDALADASFDRPPALVSNAHVTGLSRVARALDAHDVPVIALDRPETTTRSATTGSHHPRMRSTSRAR